MSGIRKHDLRFSVGVADQCSGTFEGGGTLSGTLDTDTIGNCGVVGSDLTVISDAKTYHYSELIFQQDFDYSISFWDTEFQYPSGAPTLIPLIYPGNAINLDGYTGGPLCSDTVDCNDAKSGFTLLYIDPPLISSNLSLATPEPTSASVAFRRCVCSICGTAAKDAPGKS